MLDEGATLPFGQWRDSLQVRELLKVFEPREVSDETLKAALKLPWPKPVRKMAAAQANRAAIPAAFAPAGLDESSDDDFEEPRGQKLQHATRVKRQHSGEGGHHVPRPRVSEEPTRTPSEVALGFLDQMVRKMDRALRALEQRVVELEKKWEDAESGDDEEEED